MGGAFVVIRVIVITDTVGEEGDTETHEDSGDEP
jgi:hypothetical protein